MKHPSVAVYVPVSAVFDGVDADFPTFKRILKGLSLTDTLFLCARLNLVISKADDPGSKEPQQQAVQMVFSAKEIERLNTFTRDHGGIDHVRVFFRGQMLEMIRWACCLCKDLPDDGSTFDSPGIRREFAKAVLIASHLYGQRVSRDVFDEGVEVEERRRRALGPIRQIISESKQGIPPYMAAARGHLLFTKYFPSFYPNFAREFEQRIGLTVDEYYVCMCTMMSRYINTPVHKGIGGGEGTGIFALRQFEEAAPHMGEIFRKYLALESISAEGLRRAFWGVQPKEPDEYALPQKLKPFRQTPIFRAADGRSIVMDPVLYADKAAIGPLFHLLSENTPRKEANRLFDAFGDAVEAYVCDVLRNMYPDPGEELAKRLICDVHGKDEAGNDIQVADACLNDVIDLTVLEVKAVWVKDDKVLGDGPETYLNHLREKYGKGIRQLARTVTMLAQGRYVTDELDMPQVRRIIPVLIVYDDLVATPVSTHFFASEFRAALAPGQYEKGPVILEGRIRVDPIIVLALSDLEHLEYSLEHFSLAGLLKDYDSDRPDRIESLHNYMASNLDKYPCQRNERLRAHVAEMLRATGRRVFPDEWKKREEKEHEERDDVHGKGHTA